MAEKTNYKELEQRIRGLEKKSSNRRPAGGALGEFREFKEKIISESPIGMSIYDVSGQCVAANDSIAQIIGATRSQVLEQNYNNIESWKKSGLLDKAKSAVTENSKKRHELKVKSTFGKDVSLDCHLVPFSSEGQNHLLLMINDITERKQAEEALRKSEERYRTLVETMSDGLGVQDENGVITYINDRLCEMLGYSRDEIMGRPIMDFLDEANGSILKERMSQRKKGGIEPYEITWTRKDGQKTPTIMSPKTFFDSEGQFKGSFAVITDITERKRAEEEKKSLEAHLLHAQKMESIGTLAGGVAHDFNNLLMGIQGYVSLMLMDMDSTHQSYERLKNIEKQVESGARLTSHLLGYARKGKYEVKPVDLNQMLKEASEAFGRTRKKITIHRELAEDLFAIEADTGQIEQMLLNLFVNATDAMPGGGDLILSTMNVTHKDMKGRLYDPKPGKYVLLMVTDTGIGMDKETMERIFDPFFTTKEMGRGTGLGLAAAYGIIKAHGGYIDVASKKGQGATFSIYLPASERKVQKAVKTSEPFIKGTGTVLLVDDEEIILEVGKELLEGMGYRVLTAKDGKEAIEVYKKDRGDIDIVVLDMIMPNMGGGEAYDRMKEINADIKVLLSSGFSIDGEASEILERGCNGFVQKPFTVKELSTKIRSVLENQ